MLVRSLRLEILERSHGCATSPQGSHVPYSCPTHAMRSHFVLRDLFPSVCTHLGCVVPWSAAQNKFMCPCHGSQYAPDGSVVRGPAPLPLALAHCDVAEDGKILFSPWTEDDFRTGSKGKCMKAEPLQCCISSSDFLVPLSFCRLVELSISIVVVQDYHCSLRFVVVHDRC